nr:hypothetical protein [Methylomarinum sp. Ch1-1]MDP4521545.1 hypothetical protein [Methylomarinum sp. Ch1-1]
MRTTTFQILSLNSLLLFSLSASGAEIAQHRLDLTTHFSGYLVLGIFSIAYILVFLEEKLHLHKSKPVLVAAGLIWAIIAFIYAQHDISETANKALKHHFLEYSELFFS